MKESLFNTNDTTQIEKTFSAFTWINLIANAILIIAAIIVTIVLATDETVFCLIPLGAIVFLVIETILIQLSLDVKFGMYYDIRITRVIAEQKNGNVPSIEDELPEL